MIYMQIVAVVSVVLILLYLLHLIVDKGHDDGCPDTALGHHMFSSFDVIHTGTDSKCVNCGKKITEVNNFRIYSFNGKNRNGNKSGNRTESTGDKARKG